MTTTEQPKPPDTGPAADPRLAEAAYEHRTSARSIERRDQLIRDLRNDYGDSLSFRTIGTAIGLTHNAVAKIAARPAETPA